MTTILAFIVLFAATSDPIKNEPADAKGLPNRSGETKYLTEFVHELSWRRYDAALRPTMALKGSCGLVVDEKGLVAASWAISANDALFAPALVDLCGSMKFEPYESDGKRSRFKTMMPLVLDPQHEYPLAGLNDRPEIYAAHISTLYYVTSVELKPKEQKKLRDAAVRYWEYVEKFHASKRSTAQSMLRQLAEVDRLLNGAESTPSTKMVIADSGDSPKDWIEEFQPLPFYPSVAKQKTTRGGVVFDLDVDETGVVRSATQVHSTDPVFEKASRAAVLVWRFKPRRNAFRIRASVPLPPGSPKFEDLPATEK